MAKRCGGVTKWFAGGHVQEVRCSERATVGPLCGMHARLVELELDTLNLRAAKLKESWPPCHLCGGSRWLSDDDGEESPCLCTADGRIYANQGTGIYAPRGRAAADRPHSRST